MQEQAEPTSSRRPHAGRLVLGLCAMVLIAAPGCKILKSGPYESEYTLVFERGSGEIADNAIAIQVLLCDDRDGYRYPGLFGGGEVKKAQIETWMMSDDAKLKQTLKHELRFKQITFRPGETQRVTFGKVVTDSLNDAEANNATILIVANFSPQRRGGEQRDDPDRGQLLASTTRRRTTRRS